MLHLLLVGSTPLGTFLFLKNDEYIYRPRQCGQMQFFRLGACWGDQEAATGGRMSVTPWGTCCPAECPARQNLPDKSAGNSISQMHSCRFASEVQMCGESLRLCFISENPGFKPAPQGETHFNILSAFNLWGWKPFDCAYMEAISAVFWYQKSESERPRQSSIGIL